MNPIPAGNVAGLVRLPTVAVTAGSYGGEKPMPDDPMRNARDMTVEEYRAARRKIIDDIHAAERRAAHEGAMEAVRRRHPDVSSIEKG